MFSTMIPRTALARRAELQNVCKTVVQVRYFVAFHLIDEAGKIQISPQVVKISTTEVRQKGRNLYQRKVLTNRFENNVT